MSCNFSILLWNASVFSLALPLALQLPSPPQHLSTSSASRTNINRPREAVEHLKPSALSSQLCPVPRHARQCPFVITSPGPTGMAFRARPRGRPSLSIQILFTCFPEWNKNISTNIKKTVHPFLNCTDYVFLDSSQILTALEDCGAMTLWVTDPRALGQTLQHRVSEMPKHGGHDTVTSSQGFALGNPEHALGWCQEIFSHSFIRQTVKVVGMANQNHHKITRTFIIVGFRTRSRPGIKIDRYVIPRHTDVPRIISKKNK